MWRASRQLIVFTRRPAAGNTKTRLIPVLGTTGAADLQRRMTEATVEQALALRASRRVRVTVACNGATKREMGDWLGPGLRYRSQVHGDLGARMAAEFRNAFADGAEHCVLIGCDCPGIDETVLGAAFGALQTADLVLGPARDGGYVLIGLRRGRATAIDNLFQGISWGTAAVLTETVRAAAAAQLSRHLLPELIDVDEPADLAAWERVARRESHLAGEPRIAVIVPAVNEAEHLPSTLAAVRTAANVEAIVVAGGDRDITRAGVAADHGAAVLHAAAVRGARLNLGARASDADILLFLHADTRLPLGYDTRIRRVLRRAPAAAGAFRLRIDAPGASLRLIEAAANWRSRALGLPYGDQALFCRRATFETVGGFPELPIMEDAVMARRLQRHGRLRILPVPVTTSARRWQRLGPWRTVLQNQLIIAGYLVGIDPTRLARWYRAEPAVDPRLAP